MNDRRTKRQRVDRRKVSKSKNDRNVGTALDQAYNLGFFDGEKNVAEKIKADIEQLPTTICTDTCRIHIYANEFKENVLAALDKYTTKEDGIRNEDKQAGQQQTTDTD